MAILDQLFARPEKATMEKAVTGPGAAVMSWGMPIMNASNSTQQMMKDAQAVYARGNRWVKRAEMTISGRVGGVAWHLETDDGDTVTDESPEQLRLIRDVLEKPLGEEKYSRQYPAQPTTRRELWGVTSRHMGLCNVGFWYLDEIDRAIGWPQRIFFIRPDRMTPEESQGRLTGWTLDKDAQGGGTALSLDEVLPFYLDPPDRGHFGTGLVESILSTTPLPSAIDRHAIDTLGSGGRLPGVYSPKEAAGDDVFDRLVTDLRVIKDMPDSSKRDVVARWPIEFTPTAADMGSLAVEVLSRISRDDTLAHWGVPLSTIGGYTPAGMNSGETRKYDEAALWQNAVGFRIAGLRETLQFRLLDRLKGIGINLQLVIEEPSFDDDTPKFELAAKAVSLPLRNIERRALLGLDPFGDPLLDNAVWMPVNIVALSDAPEAPVEGKASLTAEVDQVREASVKRTQRELTTVLAEMRSEILGKVREKAAAIARKPKDVSPWWHEPKWRKRLEQVLKPQMALAAERMSAKVEAKIGKRPGKADPLLDDILAKLLPGVGTRITGILDTTRDEVRNTIERGIREGRGAADLGDLIEEIGTFSELRAETIARTETGTALNLAATETYREYGVSQVDVIDGDEDEECAAANGSRWTLEEAESRPLEHPNCTRDFVPVIGAGKAAPIPQENYVPERRPDVIFGTPQVTMPVTFAPTFQMPEQAPPTVNVSPTPVHVASPVVNVEAPIVNVPEQAPPIVNVEAPIVNVPAPEKATLPQDVRVIDMPDRMYTAKKTVKRDAQGLIVQVDEKAVEETAE